MGLVFNLKYLVTFIYFLPSSDYVFILLDGLPFDQV